MSATGLIRGELSGPGAAEISGRSRALPHLPAVIGVGVLAIILYAAFAHGAVGRADQTRTELFVAGAAAVGVLGLLWTGTLRLRSSRLGWGGVALLVGFAGWCGASLLWSVAPDQTWMEVNRVITYTTVLCLGMVVGASYADGLRLVAQGFLAVALIVTAYALGQKLFPGLHVPGVFTLNQTGPLARLQEPLGYWNALALFITMGAPLALAMAVDPTRSPRARLLSAGALEVVLVTITFTYSRGGLLALALALVAVVVLGAEKLRSSVWLALIALSALPAILVGLLVHPLSAAGVPLGRREGVGAILALVLAASLIVLALVGRRLITHESRIEIPRARVPATRRAALALCALAVGGGLLAVALSSRGLGGTFAHLWHGFTNTSVSEPNNPSRLLSAVSQDRWVWWKEAAQAFGARPWGGWGAGSYPVVHLLYRQDSINVLQPHEVPLQLLAETGLIGALLVIGAFVLLLSGGLRGVRRRLPGRERLLAAGLAAGVLAYGVHCLYDWDWNIPAVSLPAFLFLGAVVASRGPYLVRRRPPRGTMLRVLGLGAGTAWLCTFALSADLPELAASKVSAALVDGSGHSAASLRAARAEASAAVRLDPLSDAGYMAQATLALHVHNVAAARSYLRDAVARDPTDPVPWRLLALVDLNLGRLSEARQAGQRALNLDPMGKYAQAFVTRQLSATPPSSSATRYP